MRRRFNSSLIFDLLLAIVFVVAIVVALGYNSRARFAPLVVTIPGLLVLVGRIINQLVRSKPASGAEPESGGTANAVTPEPGHNQPAASAAKDKDDKKHKRDLKSELNAVFWVIGLFVLLYIAGFVVAIPVYLFLFMKVRSKEKIVFSVVFSVISCAFMYLFFIHFLHIPLYQGIIAENLF